MSVMAAEPGPPVFVSYASRNRARVVEVVRHLEAAGVRVWRDDDAIVGGDNYGPSIVDGVRRCAVVLLMCTDDALRSKNVKQEIQLAWRYGKPYLPLLVEPTDGYPEQVQYWLEGCQWIEVLDRPPERWLPRVLAGLAHVGVGPGASAASATAAAAGDSEPGGPGVVPARPAAGFDGLRALARFTDQIWPVPADRARGHRAGRRDLGAPQDDVEHGHRVGSRVGLAIESDRAGHLLLLDQGPTGRVYCLCPSAFAPDTVLPAGRSYLPQPGSRYDAFVVSGQPGREHLLAIVTDEPLGLDLRPADPRAPARTLTPDEIEALLARLRDLPPDRWAAIGTYFDVLPRA